MEGERFALYPVGSTSGGNAGATYHWIEVEKEGQMGLKSVGREAAQLQDGLPVEASPGALVGQGGVFVAVAKDPDSLFKGGADLVFYELGSAGAKEEKFGARDGSGAVYALLQDVAYGFSDGCASGLSGLKHLNAFLAEVFGCEGYVGAFPDAFASFEGDELSLGHYFSLTGGRLRVSMVVWGSV